MLDILEKKVQLSGERFLITNSQVLPSQKEDLVLINNIMNCTALQKMVRESCGSDKSKSAVHTMDICLHARHLHIY